MNSDTRTFRLPFGLKFTWSRLTYLDRKAPLLGYFFIKYGKNARTVRDPANQYRGFEGGFWVRPWGVFNLHRIMVSYR